MLNQFASRELFIQDAVMYTAMCAIPTFMYRDRHGVEWYADSPLELSPGGHNFGISYRSPSHERRTWTVAVGRLLPPLHDVREDAQDLASAMMSRMHVIADPGPPHIFYKIEEASIRQNGGASITVIDRDTKRYSFTILT